MKQLIVPVVLALSACSIAQPHPDLVDTLSAARVVGGVSVESHERWVLTPLSAVRLQSGDSRYAHLESAARQGLSESLRVAEDAPWHVVVHWPDAPQAEREATREFLRVDLLPWQVMVPLPAERQRLVVDVLDASGVHWVQRLHVDVEPWWFGADWRSEEALTRAFAAVGRALVGT